jgi:hypothetical protein
MLLLQQHWAHQERQQRFACGLLLLLSRVLLLLLLLQQQLPASGLLCWRRMQQLLLTMQMLAQHSQNNAYCVADQQQLQELQALLASVRDALLVQAAAYCAPAAAAAVVGMQAPAGLCWLQLHRLAVQRVMAGVQANTRAAAAA